MRESTWREGQFDAVRHGEGVASARGRLAQICSYGNIYANGCDIVDEMLDPENRGLLLAAMAEADGVVYEPDHFVTLDGDGWFIEHSMACRLAGTLGTCEYYRAVRLVYDEPPPPGDFGRWRITDIDEVGLPSLERVATESEDA